MPSIHSSTLLLGTMPTISLTISKIIIIGILELCITAPYMLCIVFIHDVKKKKKLKYKIKCAHILGSSVCLYTVCIINKVYTEFGLLISLSQYNPGKNICRAAEGSFVLPSSWCCITSKLRVASG